MEDRAAPISPESYAVGDVIAGKYRLECLLGEGGQAWVWQARNLALDARVAIKVLRTNPDGAPQNRRLLQEARAAARLGHPAIVRVFDLGEAPSGSPFLVMELLEGESLADRLVQKGRLSPIEAVRLLLPIVDALRVAHAKGIVHRDLKPDNVFLTLNDDVLQPKLLDFGIVKIQQTPSRWEQATGAGVVVGSPAYLSPEQACGEEDVDHRADIWGLCVTLYECLSGELPFDGANYNALLRNIVEEEPPPLRDHGVNEPELAQIVSRGMAKSRDQRWPSALALGQALARWASARGATDDVCRTPLELRWLRADAQRAPQSKLARVGLATFVQRVGRSRLLAGGFAAILALGAVAALFRGRVSAPIAEEPRRPALTPSAGALALPVASSRSAASSIEASTSRVLPASSAEASATALAPASGATVVSSSPPPRSLPSARGLAASTTSKTSPAKSSEPPLRKSPGAGTPGSGGRYLISPY